VGYAASVGFGGIDLFEEGQGGSQLVFRMVERSLDTLFQNRVVWKCGIDQRGAESAREQTREQLVNIHRFSEVIGSGLFADCGGTYVAFWR
jgi:hypothetical protein